MWMILVAVLANPIDYDMLSAPIDYGQNGDVTFLQEETKSVVRIYTASWHKPCRVLKRNLTSIIDVKIQWIDEVDTPTWVRTLPTIHWEKTPGNWRQLSGAVSREQFDSIVLGKQPSFSKYVIQFSGRQWTWPGSIRNHLLGEIHQFTEEELKGFSDAELIQIHNYEHEHNLPRAKYPLKIVLDKRFPIRQYCPT